MTSVVLVSAPWKAQWMPSIQLAALGAWVRDHCPDIEIHELHHYLDVARELGPGLYDALSEGSDSSPHAQVDLPEAFYACLLFPEERPRISRAITECGMLLPTDIDQLLGQLSCAAKEWANQVQRAKPSLIGFSLAFYQTFSSLYLAATARRVGLSAPIVFGGPEVAGEVGASLLNVFPQLDFIVSGEGETPLAEMCTIVASSPIESWKEQIAALPGVQTRQRPIVPMPQCGTREATEIADLDDLPFPDFRAYFQSRPADFGAKPVHLPIETSRGCWWDRSHEDVRKSCSFCNLNATWSHYREKSPERASTEIRTLVSEYRCPRVILVDNILRQGKGLNSLLNGLSSEEGDWSLMLEAKASLRPVEFARLRAVGVEEMQLGIEALDTAILRNVIRKGTTAFQNVRALRWMEDLGIRHVGYIIGNYPGVRAVELREQLLNLRFVSGYQPLRFGRFSLGLYSPMHRMSKQLGLTNVRNRETFDACLPEQLRTKVRTLEKDWDQSVDEEVSLLWAETRLFMHGWRVHFDSVTRSVGVRSLLTYRDFGDFLEVTDRRETEFRRAVFQDWQRECLLAATIGVGARDLVHLTPGSAELERFIFEMCSRRLVFREGDSIIFLPVREMLNGSQANLPCQVQVGNGAVVTRQAVTAAIGGKQ